MKEKRVVVEKNKCILVKTRTCICFCFDVGSGVQGDKAGTVSTALTPAGRLAVGRGTAGGHFVLRLCLSQRYCPSQRYYSVPLPQSQILQRVSASEILQRVSASDRDRPTTACL